MLLTNHSATIECQLPLGEGSGGMSDTLTTKSLKGSEQEFVIIPSFQLESGVILQNVPIAYRTWGVISSERNNCIVVCHPAFHDTDVSSWWSPLMGGEGHAFDVRLFFVICINTMGSPFGSASPRTVFKGAKGPTFPLTTIRDDVR